MKKILIVLCVLFVSFGAIHAQGKVSEPALDMSIEFSDDFDSVTPKTKQDILDLVNTSLTMVRLFPPAEDNFFNWTGSKEQLKGKDVVVYYANSSDKYISSLSKELGMSIDDATDAMTLVLGQSADDIKIFICLFHDKIFFDRLGMPRSDAFARLSVSLAHEIYGHLPVYLKLDYAKETPPDTKTSEVKAFTKSVKFIEDVIAAFKDPKGYLYDIDNKDKLLSDFSDALTREQKFLEVWKK